LHFEKLFGDGPDKGWVSLAFKGQSLVVERPRIDTTKTTLLSREQCVEAQQALKAIVSKQDMQDKIEKLHVGAAGDERKFQARMTPLLIKEVYSRVIRQLGISDEQLMEGTMLLLQQSIPRWQPGDLEITKNWSELETLIRNRERMKAAWNALQSFGPSAGASVENVAVEEDDESDDENEQVYDASGNVLGTIVQGRIRGGCAATKCSFFQGLRKKPRTCRCGFDVTSHADMGPAPTLTRVCAWSALPEARS
jgi:hypothetical protein